MSELRKIEPEYEWLGPSEMEVPIPLTPEQEAINALVDVVEDLKKKQCHQRHDWKRNRKIEEGEERIVCTICGRVVFGQPAHEPRYTVAELREKANERLDMTQDITEYDETREFIDWLEGLPG